MASSPFYDVITLGGGPAGATFSRLLDPRFRNLLLFEEKEKPCGGLLSEDSLAILSSFQMNLPKEILVDPQIFSVKTMDLSTGLVRHYRRFYLNLDRKKLDAFLRSQVSPLTQQISGKVVSIRPIHPGFLLTLQDGRSFACRYLVGADGANSLVRHFSYPQKDIRRYTAIQQWFPERHPTPFYSCIFDPETSDCCSWSISKDQHFVFGGAFPTDHARDRFELQKKKLSSYGFRFGAPLKTEACQVLRPQSVNDLCLGHDRTFLLGEAAGFISPSSLEGISYAMKSAQILADIFNRRDPHRNMAYQAQTLPLRGKIGTKILKTPFLYEPPLRHLIMASGISSLPLR